MLVTGAARGIGACIAELFAREGARVALNDVDPKAAQGYAEELAKSGIAESFPADVSDPVATRKMVEAVVKRFGSLDILINNAGVLTSTPTEELSVEQWDRTLAINLKGVFLCCQATLPIMKRQQSGKIINISSLAGESGGFLVGLDYAASKGGILALTKKLALELAPFNIQVNAIAPGFTDTSLSDPLDRDALISRIPLRRAGKPADTAHAVRFLAGEEASFITGATLDVNGGLLMR